MKKIEMYFIKDDYFAKFKDPTLMANKEAVGDEKHDRPFFYTFKDKKNPEIYWMVPASSQYIKYKKIYDNKIKKYGHCETIVFGKAISKNAAFLIQNMCPATKKYLIKYVDSNNNPIRIRYDLAAKIEKNANYVLFKESKGIRIVFPDIKEIYKALELEIKQEKETKNNVASLDKKEPIDLNAYKQKAQEYYSDHIHVPSKSKGFERD